jgi:5-formyltetrahydrofolate cyclo-ligase
MSTLTKQEIRQQALLNRKAISYSERALAEMDITQKLLIEISKLSIDKHAGFIALYQSMGSEVDTAILASQLAGSGYQIAYPHVLGDGLMEFWDSAGSAPDSTGAAADFIKPEQIAVMVVPLVAFDAAGNRIGLGGGYYDRYIPRLLPQTPTVGIAFDQQLSNDLPIEPHDIALFAIITPSVVFSRRANQ